MGFSKKLIEEELLAINDSLKAHEAQTEIHEKMIKREEFLKVLVEKELEKFK